MDDQTLKHCQHLWNDLRLTAEAIGKRVGLNRNSIMGAVHRARAGGWRFDRRDTQRVAPSPLPSAPPPPRPKPKIVVQVAPKIKKRKLQPRTAQEPAEITIIELTDGHCRAVVGRAEKPHKLTSFIPNLPTYCGKPRLEGVPYCEHHRELYGGVKK